MVGVAPGKCRKIDASLLHLSRAILFSDPVVWIRASRFGTTFKEGHLQYLCDFYIDRIFLLVILELIISESSEFCQFSEKMKEEGERVVERIDGSILETLIKWIRNRLPSILN